MGTRAMIKKDGKPFLATHWDGYPSSLGKDLLKCKTDKQIIAAAKKHDIDFAHKSVHKQLNDERVKKLMKKHRLSGKGQ